MSPNHDDRPEGTPIDMLVLHYTGMRTAAEAFARLCDPAAKVSAHWFIDEDGTASALVPEARRAWHAGVSFWRGCGNLNGRSIGIELVNPGHQWGYRRFPEAQIASLIALCRGVLARHAIPARNVVAHSDVAPDRKEDPGELFPWQALAAAGIGLWPGTAPAEARALPAIGPGAQGPAVDALRRGLGRIGYRISAIGGFTPPLARVVTAFQRHWAPHRTDGIADGETRWRIGRVAALAEGIVTPL